MRSLFYLKIILISILFFSLNVYAQKENVNAQNNPNKIDKNWQKENSNVQNKINLNQMLWLKVFLS